MLISMFLNDVHSSILENSVIFLFFPSVNSPIMILFPFCKWSFRQSDDNLKRQMAFESIFVAKNLILQISLMHTNQVTFNPYFEYTMDGRKICILNDVLCLFYFQNWFMRFWKSDEKSKNWRTETTNRTGESNLNTIKT